MNEAGRAVAADRSARRAVVAASIGNAFEWYDFTVYALFAIYISKAFFPGGDSTAELVKTFLVFGVGFVVRPVGSLVLGVYGDRAGRKKALTVTFGLMALGTGLIAVAPSYVAIGAGAPLLLLVARTLQGFSAGGETGSAAALLIEHAPRHRRGEFASWIQATMAASNIMGALVAFLVASTLTQAQLETFGWRAPFAIGLLIAPVGLWIRRRLDESPEFEKALERRGAERSHPLRTVIARHPVQVLRAFGLSTLQTVSSYTLVVFMPTYVQRTFHYTASDAFAASLVANVLMVAACVAGGALSDRLGRRAVLGASAAWLALTTHGLLWLMQAQHGLTTLIVAQSLLCIGVGAFVGTAPSAVAEIFPAEVRSTGVSLSYNLAVTLFSGFAPAVLTWLTARGGVYAPGWYVVLAAAIAAPALLRLKQDSGRLRPEADASPAGV